VNVSEDVCDAAHPRPWAESSNTLGDLLNEEGPDEIPNEFDEHIDEHVLDDGAVPSFCKEGKGSLLRRRKIFPSLQVAGFGVR
jgi:hypothetical protein